jgi:hypothetical protein
VKIPNERSGLVMIFRTYNRLSYGPGAHGEPLAGSADKVRNP